MSWKPYGWRDDKVGALHKMSAKALDLLQWHLTLLKSYGWHVKR